MSEQERRVDLVCEGGGVKGIALVGALSVLEERGFQPQNVAGTSAGAIVATLLAAGYTTAELRGIIEGLDFARLKDTAWEDRIPLGGQALSILKDLGIYEGGFFLGLMRELLAAKGVRTFGDLVHPRYADQPRYRYKVRVIASDITGRALLVLPQDATRLGLANPDDFEVALAVRMSMSIPIFFEPVRFRHLPGGREHLIVDGAVLSNFPVWLFDSEGPPEWPTFGLRLVEPDPKTPVSARLSPPAPPRSGIGAVVDYLQGLIETMMEANDRQYLTRDVAARTIAIPTLGVRSTEFELTRERAAALYEAGRLAAERFLATWSFPGYIAEFRSGNEHSRRREIAERSRSATEGERA